MLLIQECFSLHHSQVQLAVNWGPRGEVRRRGANCSVIEMAGHYRMRSSSQQRATRSSIKPVHAVLYCSGQTPDHCLRQIGHKHRIRNYLLTLHPLPSLPTTKCQQKNHFQISNCTEPSCKQRLHKFPGLHCVGHSWMQRRGSWAYRQLLWQQRIKNPPACFQVPEILCNPFP
jgi:hypothetical protein